MLSTVTVRYCQISKPYCGNEDKQKIFSDLYPVSIQNNQILDEITSHMRLKDNRLVIGAKKFLVTLSSGEKYGILICGAKNKNIHLLQCKLHTKIEQGKVHLVKINERKVIINIK